MADQLSSDLASLRIDRDERPARSRGPRLILTLALLGGAVFAAYHWGSPYLEAKVFKTEIQVTEVAMVSPAEAQVTLTATGYIVPQVTSAVAPKVPGTIAKVLVDQGDRVEAGQVLAELDPRDEDAAIRAAQSRVSAAHARAQSAAASVKTRLAELEEMKVQATRQRRLAKEGVGASGIADDLEARVKSLEQGVTAAQASAQAAQAEVNALAAEASTLKVSKGNLTLVAPISGTVMNKPPQLGEYIGPQPPGISVDMGGFELADFSTNMVEADVPEARLHLVKEGGPAEIVLDAYPKKRYRGTVTQITPKVDRAKATVMVRVGFVDDMQGVLPEMSARVSFLEGELDAQAVKEPPKKVLPGNAVAERAGAKVVFVLEGDKVRMVPVELGQPFGGGFVLKQGPAPGTKLVASPPATLADGQRIKEKTP